MATKFFPRTLDDAGREADWELFTSEMTKALRQIASIEGYKIRRLMLDIKLMDETPENLQIPNPKKRRGKTEPPTGEGARVNSTVNRSTVFNINTTMRWAVVKEKDGTKSAKLEFRVKEPDILTRQQK